MNDAMQAKTRVMIVDDHTIVRHGLRTLLELIDDIEIVGEAASGAAAVELAALCRPDVILMDLVMPVKPGEADVDGIQATRLICATGSGAKIIVLTSFSEDERIIPAIQAGATSFLLKDVTPAELVDAIHAARRGETRLHPNVMRRLMEQVAAPPSPAPSTHEDLTERELDVLRLVAEGLSNRAIAGALVISEKTVKTHVSSLLSKLALQDRTQLAIYALKQGLVKPT